MRLQRHVSRFVARDLVDALEEPRQDVSILEIALDEMLPRDRQHSLDNDVVQSKALCKKRFVLRLSPQRARDTIQFLEDLLEPPR